MFLSHFLTSHRRPRHRCPRHRRPHGGGVAAEGEYVFPVGGQEKRILPDGESDGDGAGHKNACLNENATLAHLPQQA